MKILILRLKKKLYMNPEAQALQKLPRRSTYELLDKDQLNLAYSQSLKTIKTGKTLTFIGIGMGALGGILFATSLNLDSWSGFTHGLQRGMIGSTLISGGMVLSAVGIPLWVVGSSRKNNIEIALTKFEPTSFVIGIGLRIAFQ